MDAVTGLDFTRVSEKDKVDDRDSTRLSEREFVSSTQTLRTRSTNASAQAVGWTARADGFLRGRRPWADTQCGQHGRCV